mmetsp:Transcript_40207/g.63840  ORF Transcript_40207/g.63840 Transcript_40207/m.63840 type:complete len:740 (+) Transcript_40207:74-2293(+)
MYMTLKDVSLRAVCFLELVVIAWSGKGAIRGYPRHEGMLQRRLTVPGRDPLRPDHFHCNMTSCARSDNFYLIQGVDETNYTCPTAISTIMTVFVPLASQQCRMTAAAKISWLPCRTTYCETFDTFGKAVSRGDGGYQGAQCRAPLDFNHSICNYWYRDAIDFCGCICPALHLLVTTQACETQILGFLLLGRRSDLLLQAGYYLDGYCLIHFCDWIAKIADPRSQDPDAPAGCLTASLPFQRSQCLELMRTTAAKPPYTPCPWETATTKDYILNCTDGYSCDVRTDTWACCQRHGYRAQCPKNFPVMCADPLECVGDTDHCCVEVPEFCNSGVRQCSPLLARSLPEWVGKVNPLVPAYVGPATTMNPIEYAGWLSRQTQPPTEPESWGDGIMPYMLWIALPTAATFVICACCVVYMFGFRASSRVMKELFGPSRFLTLFQQDVVHVYKPDEKPKESPPLPPKISDEEILRRLANAAACESLESACQAAFRFGRSHLVNVHFSQGYGPVEEARALEQAISVVYDRHLQDVGRNRQLLEDGDIFIKTFKNETMLVNSMEKAFPILEIDWRSLAAAPVPGKPWKGTTVGNMALCSQRNAAWKIIEDLTTDIKTAREGHASHGLVSEAQKLVADLVARTPELPADRCVLDPEGHGVKLLPQGKQRALWIHTGETYMYDSSTQEAGELEDFDLAAGEELGGVSVDPCRPVCACWAKAGNCKLGRRCPWRHCKPVAGDSIREPIMF